MRMALSEGKFRPQVQDDEQGFRATAVRRRQVPFGGWPVEVDDEIDEEDDEIDDSERQKEAGMPAGGGDVQPLLLEQRQQSRPDIVKESFLRRRHRMNAVVLHQIQPFRNASHELSHQRH